MSVSTQVVVAVVSALPLFLASTVVFDGLHYVLHRMLRSRWAVVRGAAWPHGMHHRWLDPKLEVRFEHQRANIFCHIVPEYLTHLAFSGALLLVLPRAVVAGCAVLQTVVFLLILRERGLDLNHRPVPMLDAYRPMFICMPAYHALHHVFPDAHFSSYLKLVDYVVGGGTMLRGKRVALHAATDPFGVALREGLEREAVAETRNAADADAAADSDILVLCDPKAPRVELVEAFIRATRGRQLPPEVWAVHARPDDPLARHYYRDVRVIYRAIALGDPAALPLTRARRAARTVLFFIRRGFNFVPATSSPAAWLAFLRFRRTRAERPPEVPRARSRAEFAQSADAFHRA